MTRALLPNSTQVPDVILDFWVSELTGAELKVVLYVARRTYGFGKDSDNISLNQLAEGIRRRDGTVLDRGTGLSRSTVKTACSSLVKRGFLRKTINTHVKTGEFEESTYWLNLEWSVSDGPDSPPRKVGRKSAHAGQKMKHGAGRESAHVGQNVPSMVGRNPALQETEDLQDTAAERRGRNKPAVAELVSELVAQGVNRGDAVRLAHTRPGECRRQLDCFPHRIKSGLKFKRGKGAFLRRAIEDGFALPDGFAMAKDTASQAVRESAQQAAEQARQEIQLRTLRETLVRYENEQPEGFMGFLEYIENKKQVALDKPILRSAPEVRDQLLRSFETDAMRLHLFEEYLSGQTARPA